VDVGVHQDGLVHISELADRFVKDPKEVAKVGQRVTVKVLAVDMDRRRISLSMKSGAVEAGNKKTTAPAKAPPVRSERPDARFNNPFRDALKGNRERPQGKGPGRGSHV
jgi:uncharacterized protein